MTGSAPWDGDSYQRRFDELADSGAEVHGEADFVGLVASSFAVNPSGPISVLDAGCGTGRVGIELALRGYEVVGADIDSSMLATALALAPGITWVRSDLAALDLGRTFDVVVMAGNVPLFTPPGTEAALIAGCARHVAGGGVLVSGFSLGRGYEVADLDVHATSAGLVLSERWSTWDRAPFPGNGTYAVSVHRR